MCCSRIVVGLIVLFVAVFLVARDGWRQTSPESLTSRGIRPDRPDLNVMDPGLRREMAPIVPARCHPGGCPVTQPGARQPASAAGGQSPPEAAGLADGTKRSQPDATITLAGERRAAGIDDLFAALDSELIGLVPVKKKVEEIGSLLLVDRARQRFGLSASRPNLHMCFTGAPGTGKTTVALMMADLLHRLGYLEKGHARARHAR